jgi:hypothetical protein
MIVNRGGDVVQMSPFVGVRVASHKLQPLMAEARKLVRLGYSDTNSRSECRADWELPGTKLSRTIKATPSQRVASPYPGRFTGTGMDLNRLQESLSAGTRFSGHTRAGMRSVRDSVASTGDDEPGELAAKLLSNIRDISPRSRIQLVSTLLCMARG